MVKLSSPKKFPMCWSLSRDDLAAYTARQLRFFSVKPQAASVKRIRPYMKDALHRVERCFVNIRKKYYFDQGRTLFNHLHGDHYAAYLYFLSNTVFQTAKDEELAQQLFLLNKALHAVDLFYAVKLPEIFLLVHPVGTVLGNASYKNYFVAYQNCGVGSLEDGKYPTFDGENILFARSAILGNCRIGRNVVMGANSFLLATDIPDNSTVVGAYPNHRILANPSNVVDRLFRA